jgi:hypothetical protein
VPAGANGHGQIHAPRPMGSEVVSLAPPRAAEDVSDAMLAANVT